MRECKVPRSAEDGEGEDSLCDGSGILTERCNENACPYWSEWTEWMQVEYSYTCDIESKSFMINLYFSHYNFSAQQPAEAAQRSGYGTACFPRRGTRTGRTSTAVPGTLGRCGPATRRGVPPGRSGHPGPSAPRPVGAAGGSGRGESGLGGI